MSVAFPRSPGGPSAGVPSSLDEGVLARCRTQDPMAFRAFVVRYERTVFALLSRMVGRGPEVEDLAQETFVRAYRAFPSFDPDGPAKVSTWLLTIATRLALDVKKRRRVAGTPLELGDDARGVQPETERTSATPERSLATRELGDALSRAAEALPDEQRAALLLSDLHGFSIAEIASALEVPEATAKTRLFRAREKMRDALRGDWRSP